MKSMGKAGTRLTILTLLLILNVLKSKDLALDVSLFVMGLLLFFFIKEILLLRDLTTSRDLD